MSRSSEDYNLCTEVAFSVIEQEAEYFNSQNGGQHSDSHLKPAALFDIKLHLLDLLRDLAWRALFQWRVFRIFWRLCRLSYCTVSPLRKLVSYDPTSANFRMTQAALMCFPIFDDLEKSGREAVGIKSPNVDWQSFQAPLEWLTVMVAQSPVGTNRCINEISRSGLLGRPDQDRLDLHALYPPPTKLDVLDTAEQVSECQPLTPCFGLILPTGGGKCKRKFTVSSLERQFYRHFSRIAKAYVKCFPVLNRGLNPEGDSTDETVVSDEILIWQLPANL
ncbi:MAG: hypothetical protein Q9172_002631 [Xanthocarpia lactea]